MWSLGCMLLDAVSYELYGTDGYIQLRQRRTTTGNGSLETRFHDGRELKVTVQQWIRELEEKHRDDAVYDYLYLVRRLLSSSQFRRQIDMNDFEAQFAKVFSTRTGRNGSGTTVQNVSLASKSRLQPASSPFVESPKTYPSDGPKLPSDNIAISDGSSNTYHRRRNTHGPVNPSRQRMSSDLPTRSATVDIQQSNTTRTYQTPVRASSHTDHTPHRRTASHYHMALYSESSNPSEDSLLDDHNFDHLRTVQTVISTRISARIFEYLTCCSYFSSTISGG